MNNDNDIKMNNDNNNHDVQPKGHCKHMVGVGLKLGGHLFPVDIKDEI